MIEVITFNYQDEELLSNTYLLVDSNKDVVVIDPGKNYDGISAYIIKNQLRLKAVLLTHVHFDHIQGVDILLAKHDAPLYCHFEDGPKLQSPYLNCSNFLDFSVIVKSKPTFLRDKEILKGLLEEEIKVIHTPFHTSGSVCYYLKKSKKLFSGDTLFRHTIGRYDLPTGSKETIASSLNKLKDLPDEVDVYPGHNRQTTIGFEKAHNRNFL